MIKELCNQIGQDHFGPSLVNQNFPKIWGMQKKPEILNDCPFNLLPPKNNDKI